jgi:hypothetical protein
MKRPHSKTETLTVKLQREMGNSGERVYEGSVDGWRVRIYIPRSTPNASLPESGNVAFTLGSSAKEEAE